MNQSERNQMQAGANAEPVIENESLPAMGDEVSEGIMTGQPSAERAVMSDPPPGDVEPDEPYPDMVPLEENQGGSGRNAMGFAAGRYGEGYLRLVINVEDENMSVIDAAVIEGPVVQQPDLTGEMVYEVVIDGRRVAAEALPDLAVSRSLAPPDDPGRGHHFTRMQSFDFVVRIPRGEVTQEELERVQVELVRPERTTDLSEMGAQPGVPFAQIAADRGAPSPNVIARLDGIDLSALPARAAAAVREGLR